jgi:hypothetical protein
MMTLVLGGRFWARVAGFWAGFSVHSRCGEQGDGCGVQSKGGRFGLKMITFDDIEKVFL